MMEADAGAHIGQGKLIYERGPGLSEKLHVNKLSPPALA